MSAQLTKTQILFILVLLPYMVTFFFPHQAPAVHLLLEIEL